MVGSFVVDPCLYLKDPPLLLPLDSLCCLTVIPKWLPTIQKWDSFFKAFSEHGYNMIHFAPINHRGISNSPYAIFDQLSISNDVFETYGLSESDKQKQLIDKISFYKLNYGLISVSDIVWNHTSCNSEWLLEHPEAAYNLNNSPHLRPAYDIDQALMNFSNDISLVHGHNSAFNSEHELDEIMTTWSMKILPIVKLWEYYVINVQDHLERFTKLVESNPPATQFPYDNIYTDLQTGLSIKQVSDILLRDSLIEKPFGYRNAKQIDLNKSLTLISKVKGDRNIIDFFKALLDEANLTYYREHDSDVYSIFDQVKNRARYLRLSEHGPKLGALSCENPMVDTYFTRLPFAQTKFEENDMILANNGWIWNADPLVNFASSSSKAYLRREVIVWGDCVKLRYGNGPSDNPWLYEHMKKYTLKMAHIFDGFRIDNCHSTPIHVASYLLDSARILKPNLYVFAELFTGSESKDVTFVSKLGINSLIREAMNTWDSTELARLSHKYGGQPIGSLSIKPENIPLDFIGHQTTDYLLNDKTHSEIPVVIEIMGSDPHALFMDCTHDNETPYQTRTAQHTLPNSAVVCMTQSAIGSVKGYDEIVPHLLNIVTETKKYRIPDKYEGIIMSKAILQKLHTKMSKEGFNEIHVHQENDFITIHRSHPVTHEGYLLIARTAFRHKTCSPCLNPILLKHQNVQLVQSATLTVHNVRHSIGNNSIVSPILSPSESESNLSPYDSISLGDLTEENSIELPPSHNFQTTNSLFHCIGLSSVVRAQKIARIKTRIKEYGLITGLSSSLKFSTTDSDMVTVKTQSDPHNGQVETTISVTDEFVPGSIVLYRTWIEKSGVNQSEPIENSIRNLSFKNSIMNLWSLIGCRDGDQINMHKMIEYMVKAGWNYRGEDWFPINITEAWPKDLLNIVSKLAPQDINVLIYRSNSEELDVTPGFGVYDVPGYGPLSYCGLQGIVSIIMSTACFNSIDHPIYENMRQGSWLMEYIVSRLSRYSKWYPNLISIQSWLSERFEIVSSLPKSLIPKYFCLIVCLLYQCVKNHSINVIKKSSSNTKLSPLQSPNSLNCFKNSLAMCSFQMFGRVSSAGLFPSNYPLLNIQLEGLNEPSLAAGLPHFATNHMRCWGRDIFIAIPGLMLELNQYEQSKSLILAFGSTLKHGLIPNLLDSGNYPRYNARDASFWWLYALQKYCEYSPNGYSILDQKVYRRFPPFKRYRYGTPDYLKSNDDLNDVDISNEDSGDIFVTLQDARCFKYESKVSELVHEILERHARGISFREWNAGTQLDHAMKPEGFDIRIGTDWDTGFVYGGNKYNCGTWMDKMGDSLKAGNVGVPATPRDSSPIEIIGLLKSALNWITTRILRDKEVYNFPCSFIERNDGTRKSYKEWNELVQYSFEPCFYIPLDPNQDSNYKLENKSLINKRGIYKDVYNSSVPWLDFQLRPNYAVAIVVAPELFEPKHAYESLKIGFEYLSGTIGIKTLDYKDWAYRGTYDNSNDSNDPFISHGYNYHQGPEWVWIYAYFLRAYLSTCSRLDKEPRYETERLCLPIMNLLFDLKTNPWSGVPELTNANGSICFDSCPTQAWSSACLIELVRDIEELKEGSTNKSI